MYENKVITEPKWKSWIIQTTTPLFTPDQCREIIASGRAQKPQVAQVGMGQKPQIFLKDGDVMTLNINSLGEQKQKVISSKAI